MSEQKDTEIILGTGKLLAIFFGLVAICGTFFGLGYSLGRTASPMALQSGPATVVSGPGTKPVAGVTLTTPAAVTEPPSTNANAPTDSQTAQNSSADVATADRTADNAGQTPTVRSAAQTSTSDVATTSTATPELQGGSITVQVAAVTKEEDAQALVSALRRKNYPVFVSPNASSDNLYHVQVGPFAELKDAEAMKGKLAGDGYNAIVKK
jgi:cell division septation protein DedD